jgi:hypothetical protein
MNTKQLPRVNRAQSKKLRKLGFDWGCDYSYAEASGGESNSKYEEEGRISCSTAPSVALALQWIREEKEIGMQILLENDNKYYAAATTYEDEDVLECKGCDTWEAAESALLDELLIILK